MPKRVKQTPINRAWTRNEDNPAPTQAPAEAPAEAPTQAPVHPVNPFWRVKQRPSPPPDLVQREGPRVLPPRVSSTEVWAAWTQRMLRMRDERARVDAPVLVHGARTSPATSEVTVTSAYRDHIVVISSDDEEISSASDNFS